MLLSVLLTSEAELLTAGDCEDLGEEAVLLVEAVRSYPGVSYLSPSVLDEEGLLTSCRLPWGRLLRFTGRELGVRTVLAYP